MPTRNIAPSPRPSTQISAQAKEAERRAAGLHPHLAAAQKAVEQKRQVVSARQADVSGGVGF